MTIADWMFAHPYLTTFIAVIFSAAIANIGNRRG